MTDTTEFDNINGMTVARLRRWDICDEDNVADASSRRLYANLKQFYSKFKHLYAVLVLISSRQKMQWCLNLRLFHVWLWRNDTQQVN